MKPDEPDDEPFIDGSTYTAQQYRSQREYYERKLEELRDKWPLPFGIGVAVGYGIVALADFLSAT